MHNIQGSNGVNIHIPSPASAVNYSQQNTHSFMLFLQRAILASYFLKNKVPQKKKKKIGSVVYDNLSLYASGLYRNSNIFFIMVDLFLSLGTF